MLNFAVPLATVTDFAFGAGGGPPASDTATRLPSLFAYSMIALRWFTLQRGKRVKAIHRVWQRADEGPPCSLDLSGVSFFEPYDLVYLCLLTNHLLAHEDQISVLLPTNPDACRYLQRMRVIDRLTGEEGEPARFFRSTSLAGGDVIQIPQRTDMDLADAYYDTFLRWLSCDPSLRPAMGLADLVDAFCEMVSNFGYHSQGDAAYFAGQYYPRSKAFRMAIGDLGVGIRASLATNPEHAYLADKTDEEAMLKAVEPGVYGGKIGGGMGFPSLCDLVDKHNGSLYITSGTGRLVKYGGQRPSAQQLQVALPGVQMEVTVHER